MGIDTVCVLAAVSVGRRGPGGDGEAEEGAHRGAEGDQEAAGARGEHGAHQPLPVHMFTSI